MTAPEAKPQRAEQIRAETTFGEMEIPIIVTKETIIPYCIDCMALSLPVFRIIGDRNLIVAMPIQKLIVVAATTDADAWKSVSMNKGSQLAQICCPAM